MLPNCQKCPNITVLSWRKTLTRSCNKVLQDLVCSKAPLCFAKHHGKVWFSAVGSTSLNNNKLTSLPLALEWRGKYKNISTKRRRKKKGYVAKKFILLCPVVLEEVKSETEPFLAVKREEITCVLLEDLVMQIWCH